MYRFGECGGSFKTPNGILTSPSYPENYPPDADCVYTITQLNGTVIVLNFHDMDLPDRITSCGYKNYLEIRDGPTENSPLIDKICGNDIPGPIISNQTQLWMRCVRNYVVKNKA